MTKIKIAVVSSGRSLVDTTRKLAIEKGIDIHSAYVGLDDAIEMRFKTVNFIDRFEQQIPVVDLDGILVVGMDLLHT